MSKLRNYFEIRKVRKAVILAAQLVESGYEPELANQFDPDDLLDLRRQVRKLRVLENPKDYEGLNPLIEEDRCKHKFSTAGNSTDATCDRCGVLMSEANS